MIRLFYIFIYLFLLSNLNAKEIFTKEHLLKYITIENPFIYSAIGQRYIYKEKENFQLGNFDTKLVAQYDKKDYPLSQSEFISAGVQKPIENGMEFSVNYRYARGTQEYNNIKTGENGEVLVGIKIPVFSVAKNMNERKLKLHSSRLDTSKMNLKAQDNLRKLYFDIFTSYYKLLYIRQSSELISQLLSSAEQRVSIIKKRVDVGSLAKISYLEASQQIINRKQMLISINNKYENALNSFLRYLNINKTYFKNNYTLPYIVNIKKTFKNQKVSLEDVLTNRPDLKVYLNEIKKLDLENKFTNISKYPNVDLGLYGVHDFDYDNGFKITIGMDFPIERRKYISKSLEIKKSVKNINKLKDKKIINIKTELQIINNSIKTLDKNIKNSQLEVELVEKLESAESKKYDVGLSNLFMLNQREIYTLQIKKKLLKYNLDYLLLQQKLQKVMGKSFDIFVNN